MTLFDNIRRKSHWLHVAQQGELEFHKANEWRQTDDFMRQTAYIMELWGYSADDFDGKTVIDLGAGSKLRSKYFAGARIIAIEPLADRFRAEIPWCDLDDAAAVYSVPAEKYIAHLKSNADFVMCINALDHSADPKKCLRNMSAYLRAEGHLCLSVDLHDGKDAMHPVAITEDTLNQMLSEVGLAKVLRSIRGLGERGPSYGTGECITVLCQKP